MAFERCVGCRWYSETMNWCYDPEKGKNCDHRIAWEDNRMGRK